MLKPVDSAISTGTAFAPENSTMEPYMGNPGSGYMISVPDSPSISMAKNIVGFPPGTIRRFSGSTTTPCCC